MVAWRVKTEQTEVTVGSILKDARRRLGWRVKDVTAKTSARISASYLSCIENDLRLPSEELLLELALLLNLDQRELYLRLVRAKAPAIVREQMFAAPESAPSTAFVALRELPLREILERAADADSCRQESERLRREVTRLQSREGDAADFATHWERTASRYRMHIERTVLDAELSLEGDVTLHRHVIGLTPRRGRAPLLAIQHVVRVHRLPGTSEDDGFKLLEQPDGVPLEVEREQLGADQSLIRICFPDGLTYAADDAHRVSYSIRSTLRGAYSMERAAGERMGDAFADADGRSNVIVFVDKPCDVVEVVVRFPRYYVADGIEAWAGTQEFYETQDNFIEERICESWELSSGDDYRAVLRIHKPQIGMKFGVIWRPLYREEFQKVKRRLERETES